MPQTNKAEAAALPSLEQVTTLAVALAQREAHRPDDVDDLVQVGLFAYHRARQRHVRKGLTVRKPWALVRTTLQRAMWGCYTGKGRQLQSMFLALPSGDRAGDRQLEALVQNDLDIRPVKFDLPTADLRGHVGGQSELFEFEDFFTALTRECGPLARKIVENLILPDDVCSVHIMGEVRTKERAQAQCRRKGVADRRKQPRGVKQRIRITPRLIRESLGLTTAQWSREMNRIREFARVWMRRA